MCEVVSALEDSGRSELESVFSEADAHGVGASVRKTWENDKRNLKEQFQFDQLTLGNGSNIDIVWCRCMYHWFNTETGNRGNRWSPITIHIGRF